MGDDEVNSVDMLAAARMKAQKLLDDMLRHQSEIRAEPGSLSTDQVATGQTAFDNAIASTRRMIDALDNAMRLANPQQPTQ